MKTNYLLPHRWKKVGLWAALPFALVGIIYVADIGIGLSDVGNGGLLEKCSETFWEFTALDEIVVIGLTISLLVAAFSREKDEDEFTTEVRARSLVWSVVLSYAVVAVGTVCFYDFAYLAFLFANLFTILIAYILIFNISMARLRKEARDEK